MQVTWSDREIELGLVGRVGESNTRTITVDCAKIMDAYPAARIVCVISRPDDATYTVTLAEDGKKRTVTLDAVDLAMPGTLRLELRAVEGGAVLKSAILRGTVADSIRGEGDAPGQPVRDVLDRVDDTLKAAEATRKELETALGGVQGAVDAATGAADAATAAATAAEKTDAQIQVAEQGRVAAEKKREQDAAAAVQSVTDTVADVQNKLESGAFDGKDGRDGLDAPQIDDTTISDAAPWSSQHIVDMLCPPMTESGNPVTCYPVAGSTLGIKASWEPMQEGTGTPSPDNIRPIHGKTQVKVKQYGKNLLDISQCTPAPPGSAYGLTVTVDDTGIIKLSGVPKIKNEMAVASYRALFTNQVISIENYKAKAFVTKGTVMEIRTIASDKSIIIVTPLAPDTPVDIQFRIMYYVGDVPATYTPYTCSTTSLTLPSTIYGGEVEADGAGQKMRKLLTLNGKENWKTWGVDKVEAGQTGFFCQTVPYAAKTDNANIASHFAWQQGYLVHSGENIGIGIAPEDKPYLMLCVKDTLLDDISSDAAAIASLKGWLAAQYAAGTPVQVAYKLATPVPFAATGGGTIKALQGTNTILTDADALTVTGRADPIHIIQQLQAASTASAQALADVERAVTDI